MILRLTFRAVNASLDSLFRMHLRTASGRMPACANHVTDSVPCVGLYRRHFSLRTSITNAFERTFTRHVNRLETNGVVLSRSVSEGGRSKLKSRNIGISREDSRNLDDEERWPSYEADWSKQELLMLTCGGLWEHRLEGANVIVSYIDTAASIHKARRRQMPTVLVLQSGISDNIELKPVLDLMVNDGWRVVIPDVIGAGNTRGVSEADQGCFTYRLGEHLPFYYDFIHTADIHRIDLAVGHSLGCYALAALAGNVSLFGSIALIAPIPAHKPAKLIEPVWFTGRLHRWLDHMLLRYITWLWLSRVWQPRVMKWFDIGEKLSITHLCRLFNFLHMVVADVMSVAAELIKDRNIPMIYVYSDADVAEAESNVEFAEIFGARPDMTDAYDADCQPVNLAVKSDGPQKGRYVKAVRLGCSHVSHMDPAVADIVHQELRQLYKHRVAVRR